MTEASNGASGVTPQAWTPKPTGDLKNGKSLHVNVGWTFSDGQPSGKYNLEIGSQRFAGMSLNNGVIKVDGLDSLTGSGKLVISLTNGPSYEAQIELGLPDIQTPTGLARRLTNLGFYAGTDGKCNGRLAWAIRAFKRVVMNKYTRNSFGEVENNAATKALLEAVQAAYGKQAGEKITGALSLAASNESVAYCGMFGEHVYRRGSFEDSKLKNDIDQCPKYTGVWNGKSAGTYADPEPIAGKYHLYLRAFDSNIENECSNRINLPQPIHMAQFVLFELGYWLVGGKNNWVQLDNTWTCNSFIPDGGFGRGTQWAVREFQCHAKLGHSAKEDVSSEEKRYMPRLFKATSVANPPKLTGVACYPDDKPISGALNKETREALQAWADGVLRCPVIVYASTDIGAKAAVQGSDLAKLVKENIWFWDDHKETTHRMFAIDYSCYYTIPKTYGGEVTVGNCTFPKPIVLGRYQITSIGSGAVSMPPNQTWKSEDVELTPNNLIGIGGINGDGLNEKQLSTYKVIRTAALFECSNYFDCFNAWDDVTISFGPCQWTLASLSRKKAADKRELPAFLAYVKHAYPNTYHTFVGKFGLSPLKNWTANDWNRPQKDESGVIQGKGSYNENITIQTETGYKILCGASRDASENTYCKGWHWFYRFQMACRIAKYFRYAMWDFTRFRIRDILETELELTVRKKYYSADNPPKLLKVVDTKNGEKIRIGKYITSEKGVAMLLRWHIWRPAYICCQPIDVYSVDANNKEKYTGKDEDDNNYIFRIIKEQDKAYGGEEKLSPKQKQDREDAILLELKDASLTVVDKKGNPTNTDVSKIYTMKNVPQRPDRTTNNNPSIYLLDLGLDKKLNGAYGSFKLQPPEPSPKNEI